MKLTINDSTGKVYEVMGKWNISRVTSTEKL